MVATIHTSAPPRGAGEPIMTTETTAINPSPTDTLRTWNRIAGFSGVAFVVLFIAMGAAIAAAAPPFTDGADELRAWFGDNQGSIAFFNWFTPMVFGFLYLTFGVGLLRRLTAGDTSGGILPRLSFAGIVAQFAAALVGMSLWAVMSLDPVLEGASDGLLVTLAALDSVVFFALMPWATAMFIIFASVLMMQSRIMPTWLAGLGIVAGVLPVIGGTWIFSGDPESAVRGIGFIGEIGSMLWVLIASVLLIRSAAD
jgi:hypothetical protein